MQSVVDRINDRVRAFDETVDAMCLPLQPDWPPQEGERTTRPALKAAAQRAEAAATKVGLLFTGPAPTPDEADSLVSEVEQSLLHVVACLHGLGSRPRSQLRQAVHDGAVAAKSAFSSLLTAVSTGSEAEAIRGHVARCWDACKQVAGMPVDHAGAVTRSCARVLKRVAADLDELEDMCQEGGGGERIDAGAPEDGCELVELDEDEATPEELAARAACHALGKVRSAGPRGGSAVAGNEVCVWGVLRRQGAWTSVGAADLRAGCGGYDEEADAGRFEGGRGAGVGAGGCEHRGGAGVLRCRGGRRVEHVRGALQPRGEGRGAGCLGTDRGRSEQGGWCRATGRLRRRRRSLGRPRRRCHTCV
ncbi:unnamed protein product [Pedinophyceae sp. YPF-701]|nr:unnamed protein product [Pedinophyceae sp. YPF-701]